MIVTCIYHLEPTYRQKSTTSTFYIIGLKMFSLMFWHLSVYFPDCFYIC